MRTRLLSISYLLMAASLMMAQGIKRHEYWIDSDYTNHKSETSNNTTVSFTVSTAGLETGIHFLNYRVLNTDDEWGILSRTLFYVPEHAAGDATVESCEYWIDNDYASRKTGEGENSISAAIDISKLPSGIHFFNYKAVNSFGEAGTLSRSLFYIPEQREENPTITAYEYWLDEDMTTKVSGTEAKEVYELAMDISKMKDGDHTFTFRAQNSNGDWSMVHTETFVLDGNAFIKEDGVTYVAPDNGEQTLTAREAEQEKTEVEIPITIKVGETEYTVTVIAEEAFEAHTALLKITIPETVISIGASAFAGCTSLTDIFCYAKDPIALGAKSKVATRAGGDEVDVSSVFDQVNKSSCTLHVPFGSKVKYQNAEGWKEFKNIVEIISDIPGDANSDWEVSAADIDAIVEYILKGKTEGFVFENANVNGDDKVDAADIVMILNIINNK